MTALTWSPATSRGGGRRRCRRRRRRSPGRWSRRRRRAGRSGRRTCCGRRPSSPTTRSALGLDPVPEVLLHPSVIERFARCAPGLSGVARRTLRTNLRFIARRVVPQLSPADAPLPRERAKAALQPGGDRRVPRAGGRAARAARRMRAAGLVCLGAGAGLIRADLRAVRGTDVICRSGGVIVAVRGARPRAVPVLARYHDRLLAAARVRRDRAGLRRDRSRPPEHHHPADPVAGRRDRAAPAGHQPAARDLAGRGRGAARAWPRSCTPPGSPAPSGSATCSPPSTRPTRPPRSRCSGRRGEHPAGRAGGDHRHLRHRAADRAAAAHRGARPAAAGPHPAGRDAARPRPITGPRT